MIEQHQRVVHLVEMVTGQHQDVFRVVPAQDVDVLVDRVGGAPVPIGFVHALLRRQQVDEFVGFAAHEIPAALQVPQQRMRLVLRDHVDAADPGVDAVGEREIDDAELAAEMDGRLGPAVGQVLQPRAAPAGQNQGDRAFGQSPRQDHALGRVVQSGGLKFGARLIAH